MKRMRLAATTLAAMAGMGATAMPKLSDYVGKYPFDKVSGITFLKHPLVRAGVAEHAPAHLRPMMFGNVTSTPIGRAGKLIVSGSCEPHNCGSHNWTIVITANGKNGAVCHYDSEKDDEASWFQHRKLIARVEETCPGSGQPLPPAVAMMIRD